MSQLPGQSANKLCENCQSLCKRKMQRHIQGEAAEKTWLAGQMQRVKAAGVISGKMKKKGKKCCSLNVC